MFVGFRCVLVYLGICLDKYKCVFRRRCCGGRVGLVYFSGRFGRYIVGRLSVSVVRVFSLGDSFEGELRV